MVHTKFDFFLFGNFAFLHRHAPFYTDTPTLTTPAMSCVKGLMPLVVILHHTTTKNYLTYHPVHLYVLYLYLYHLFLYHL